jgi:hypothetical protein
MPLLPPSEANPEAWSEEEQERDLWDRASGEGASGNESAPADVRSPSQLTPSTRGLAGDLRGQTDAGHFPVMTA